MENEHKHINSQILWGIALIVIAILAILGKLGYLGEVSVISIILTIFFVVIIVKSIHPVSFPGILFSLAFLGIIYDRQLGIEKLTPWTLLLAALLGSIGLSLIFYSHDHRYNGKRHFDFGDHNTDDVVIDKQDESMVHMNVSFGAATKYINSDDFKYAELDCRLGALVVYFTNAVIKDGKAEINLNAELSGIELYFPKEWNIINNLDCIIGGVDSNNAPSPTGEFTVYLNGRVNMSGIDITYV